MKKIKQINWLVCACLVSLGVAGSAKQTAEKATVQGRWHGVEEDSTQAIALVFEGDHFTYWDAQTNEIGSGTFTVSDSVEPKQMDLTFEQIPAPQYEGKVGLAIFELQDDVMKIAGAEPGATQRPTNMVARDGVRVFTFRRE